MSVLATAASQGAIGRGGGAAPQREAVRRLLLATGRDEAPLPEIVQIESTNICNAKCVFCPRDDMERRQGIMDMALFQKIVDECVGARHRARPHAQLRRAVRRSRSWSRRCATRSRRASPQVGMISNGSLITEAAARGMIDAGLDAINISVDASGQGSRSRRRASASSTTRSSPTSSACCALRDAAGTARPKLILSFVRQDNSDDERAFIEHWRSARTRSTSPICTTGRARSTSARTSTIPATARG